MIATVTLFVRRLFSERRIAIQCEGEPRQVNLTRSAQIIGLCALLVGISAIAKLTASYLTAARKVAHKEAAVAQAEMSNADLRNLVTDLQGRLAAAAAENAALRKDAHTSETRLRTVDETRATLMSQREDIQNRLKGAEDALAAKSAQLARLNHSLDTTKSDLKLTEQQRAGLTARVRQLQTELRDAADQVAQLKASSDSAERKLQQAAAERAKLAAERDRLSSRLAALEATRGTTVSVADRGSDKPVETALATPGKKAPAAAESAFGRLAEDTRQGWDNALRLLASAGVDLDQMAARYGATPPGQGGPFISAKSVRSGAAEAPLPESMQKLLTTLPLTAPLAHYHLESGFGTRVDPINHRESFHGGLDFSAPFKTPVYNTAPGVVIYAGPKKDFGKVVEIDHGSGIVTRYAHLHRVMVAKGQRLTGRQQIGQLGSTGRSTGPHVHYEVLVNGTAQDPEKFLEAGKSVVQVTAKE